MGKTIFIVTIVALMTFLGYVNSLQCYKGTSAHDKEENKVSNCTADQACVNFVTTHYTGDVEIDKGCFTITIQNCNALSPSHEDCWAKNGCMKVWTNYQNLNKRGVKSTCFCNDKDLCNGSSILTVNHSFIGILVLFYFLN